MGVSAMQATINGLRAVNPNVKLAQYVVLNELYGTATPNTDTYSQVTQVNAANWWVRDAAGNRVQWTNQFGAYEVNLTNWAPTDSTGKRWPQWKAEYDTSAMFGKLSGLNYIYVDNVMYQPRYDADLMRVGTNQSRNDPTIMAAFRTGYANYWAKMRTLNPTLKIIGNADSDMSYAEYKGQIEGTFNECLMGKSWSIETWGGWDQMMKRYRAHIANTKAPHDVLFQACGISGANPAQARYGFASALLENGYFVYTVNGLTVPYWADEFSAPIGTPLDAPPTAPTSNGIWMRKYTNGLVLVNPTASALSINIGTGYKHISGTQDPVVNNGMAESTVSLPPKSGLIMVKG
ncbi:putative glycoside hydrolase [Ideonella sp. BN130291]|uniref:putative glycoside hydrolase n=1 Tax=Ideonella sp. BN130291 TaxID=3112940 RepID=UPI002E273F36|nr:putative glycoside hydrolase [Ideonella sp. BN130291]